MAAKEVKAYGFGMDGMGGSWTDPDETPFSHRVRDEVGVEIFASPYLDGAVNTIADIINGLPTETAILAIVIFVWGTSLGANNCTAVPARVKRVIDGIFGFQASSWPGAFKGPIPANVKFAHLFTSINPIPLPGLGSHIWTPGQGFNVASLHVTRRNIPHPGDYDKYSQDTFIAEMKRIKAAAANG